MICNDRNCRGEINTKEPVSVKIYEDESIILSDSGRPCSGCGLIHSEEMHNFFREGSAEVLYSIKKELIFG